MSTVLVLSVLAEQCGASNGPGRGFDVEYPDNRPHEIAALVRAVEQGARTEQTPLVALTALPPARGTTVLALPDGRRLWQAPETDSRPWIAGGTVVAHRGNQVVGWDAASGTQRFAVEDHGYALIGAGGDANAVAISLGPGGLNRRRGHFVVLDAASGATRYSRDVEQSLGVPTAVAGYALVPWNAQYVSVMDLVRGAEITRLRSLDDIYARVDHEQGALYVGGRVLYRVSEQTARGRRGATRTFAMPRGDLPGRPALFADGYAPALAGVNARERVTVLSRPDPQQPGVAMIDDAVYGLFHRVVFAIGARDGAVRWAFVNASDVVGGQVVRGGVVLVDERGTALMLDAAHGQAIWRQSLGVPAAQAVLRLPLDFAPPRAASDPALSLTASLLAVASNTDDRLLPARIFAVRALGDASGAEATAGLLDVAGRAGYPPALRAAAGEALARRSDGTDILLEALEQHQDYLRGTSPPPVGFIARALARSHERRAVPALLAHLLDPATAANDLGTIVAALREIGDPAVTPGLLDFVRIYHADVGSVPPINGGDALDDRSIPEQQALDGALVLAVEAIAQLGSPVDKRWLGYLGRDPNTLASVRAACERATPAAATANAPAGAGERANDAVAAPANAVPARLTGEMIRGAFAPARAAMLRCVESAASRPGQVRLQFRFDHRGVISNLSVVPAELTPCVAPLAQDVQLPASQTARDIGVYFLLGETP